MKVNRYIALPICIITSIIYANATNVTKDVKNKKWDLEIKAGVNVGGISPLPMPVEIRSIESYNPQFNGSFSIEATKYFDNKSKYGISVGIKIENKSMSTGAKVKNYSTEIIQDGDRVSGYWTGYVNTDYSSNFITIPITMVYKINPAWKIKAGAFAAYRLDGYFKGYVSDGYLRDTTPTGAKIEFKDGDFANFNFNNDLSRYQIGAIIGGSFKASKKFNINADLTWGFLDSFKKDFNTISFALYPIYLNFGFGYEF